MSLVSLIVLALGLVPRRNSESCGSDFDSNASSSSITSLLFIGFLSKTNAWPSEKLKKNNKKIKNQQKENNCVLGQNL